MRFSRSFRVVCRGERLYGIVQRQAHPVLVWVSNGLYCWRCQERQFAGGCPFSSWIFGGGFVLSCILYIQRSWAYTFDGLTFLLGLCLGPASIRGSSQQKGEEVPVAWVCVWCGVLQPRGGYRWVGAYHRQTTRLCI